MKKLKKLIPALCMLLVSAVLLGTTTYAWFSMNKSVAANNLGVTAKSNASYLLIGKTDNATVKTDSKEKVEETASSAKVYPVAYFDKVEAATKLGNVVLKDQNASWENKEHAWFTANNGNSTSSNDDVKNIREINEGTADYMVTYTYYITLSADSEDYLGNLNIAMTERAKLGSETTDNSGAVNVVVKVNAPKTKEGTAEDQYVNLTEVKTAGSGSNVSVYLTSKTSITVTVYVYINGEDAAVTSANATALSGKLSLAFDLGTNTANNG